MITEPSRQTPVYGEFDVVVVGGGPAGIMAATAAARAGCSAYKIAADELVTGSGARILFHAMAVGAVLAPSGGLDAVLIESKSGRQAVRGRFFIDASGDGDLAAWAGVPWEKAPPIDGMMYPSLMFRINGVDVNRAGPAPWRTVERLMEEAEAAGTHAFPRKKPIVRPQRNPLEWRANLTQLRRADGGAIDGTDVDELTRGELIGGSRRWTRSPSSGTRRPGSRTPTSWTSRRRSASGRRGASSARTS
jgi:FAD dependent oxidoreductase